MAVKFKVGAHLNEQHPAVEPHDKREVSKKPPLEHGNRGTPLAMNWSGSAWVHDQDPWVSPSERTLGKIQFGVLQKLTT